VAHKIYPNYNHQKLESSVENRFQDQTLIRVREDLSSISFTPLLETNAINLTSFSQCLIVGFGLQESSLTKTGFLSGSLIPRHKETIHLENGIITVNGAYFVELLPGDSGGPLLCYNPKEKQWFDLGTASAHSWEHESLYAANANLSFSPWPLTQSQTRTFPSAVAEQKLLAKSPQYLRPYSTVKTIDGEAFYNGDLDLVMVSDIKEHSASAVIATIKVRSASINYLCLGSFLCYGDQREVIVQKTDLVESRYKYPDLFDPFL